MTDEALAESIGGNLEVEARPKSGGWNGKKLVLIVVLPVVLLVLAGVGAYFAGLLDPLLGGESHGEVVENVPGGPTTFYDLPDMLVNLNTGGRKSSYLKISVSLELADSGDTEHLEQMMPRIVDSFQVYLRELRIEDLSGSAGLQRLREELLLRVNAAAYPAKVNDVLFKEMLVQ